MEHTTKGMLFVYGTLKKGHVNHHILESYTAIPACAPMLTLYRGPGYPVATPGVGTVYGELYEIETSILPELDRLEEVPELFVRVLHKTQCCSGRSIFAWTYIRHESGTMTEIPGGFWDKNLECEEHVP